MSTLPISIPIWSLSRGGASCGFSRLGRGTSVATLEIAHLLLEALSLLACLPQLLASVITIVLIRFPSMPAAGVRSLAPRLPAFVVLAPSTPRHGFVARRWPPAPAVVALQKAPGLCHRKDGTGPLSGATLATMPGLFRRGALWAATG